MRMRSENKGEKYLVKRKIRGPKAKLKGQKVRLRPLELFSFLFHVLQQSLFTLVYLLATTDIIFWNRRFMKGIRELRHANKGCS